MIAVRSFQGRKVALFGLGGSGLSTARALAAGGAEIAAWDDNEEARARARAAGIAVIDLAAADWRDFASLVLAPGVPLTHPKPHWTAERARSAGIEIIGDIELFCRERNARAPSARFVAITGANGKSTTTALLAHILRETGCNVQMGGNIGVPILELAPPSEDAIHVIECSSFQIDLAPSLNPSIGALLNITPDHLDRHGTLENYAAIKERLVAQADVALIGIDDEPCRAIAKRLKERQAASGHPQVVTISAAPSATSDVFVENRKIYPHDRQSVSGLGDLASAPALRGAHNGQNAAFACAAARALGLSPAQMQQGLLNFPGLPHRMEQVGRLDRVLFVNDSKATNADAAEKALISFSDIFWICGGKAKEGGIESLRPLFPRIAKAYLIGAASDEFARTLEGSVPFERCATLDVASAAAARDAQASVAAEPVVLLSPACASYDQFANFEQRGDRFRTLVAQWIAAHTHPATHDRISRSGS
jgi:UDP-N-acetylmuramoylalanine--D-glutamate ligase